MYIKHFFFPFLLLFSSVNTVKESKSPRLMRPRVVPISLSSNTYKIYSEGKIFTHYNYTHQFNSKKYISTEIPNNNQGQSTWVKFLNFAKTLSWTPIPLSIGFALIAAIKFRHIRNRIEYEHDHEFIPAKDWEITCYRLIPLRALSRVWGWLMSREIPIWLRPHLYTCYAKTFSCDLNEIELEDLREYPCLGDFFCRRLKPDARPIHSTDCLVSPADGQVLQTGIVEHERIEQVKDISYSLSTFLGETSWNKDKEVHKKEYTEQLLHNNKGTKLYQCVIYLAPGDYHRFHSPVEWKIHFRRHFQGELLSVNPIVARWIPDLFSLNERVSYVGKWKYGFFSMTAVGATNVGSIRVYRDPKLKTNQRKWRNIRHEDRAFEKIKINKGELFGEFKMGSTIVMIFEAPENFQFKPELKQKIRVGEPLTKC